MTFLHPILAAIGIAAVSIPIIIHLLMRRRRKPVMWAAMRFLLQAYKEHRRRLRLEQLLLLAARCLLVALIGLGLARPILGAASVLGGRAALTLYLLVDNSLTASARDDGGRTALQRHQAEAARLLDQLDAAAGDRAGLISLGGPALASVVPASADPAAVKSIVAQLAPTDSAADLSGALAVLDAALAGRGDAGGAGAGRTVVVVLSDFLVGSADTEKKLAALGADKSVTLLAPSPAQRGTDNVSIVGLEPLRPVLIAAASPDQPGARTPVTVRLRRAGPGVGTPSVVTARLRVAAPDDRAGPPTGGAGQGTVRFEPGQSESSATIEVGPPAGASGTVVLTATIDDDAIPGDNVLRKPLEVRSSLRVGVVSPRRLGSGVARPAVADFEPGDWVRLALDPYAGDRPTTAAHPPRDTDVIEIDPVSVDAPRLSGLDAVFLPRPDLVPESSWRHLRALADSGGLVVVSPPPGVTVHLWADSLVREMGLDWTVAREATELPEPGVIAADPPQRAEPGESLLSLIRDEFRDLVGPVRVFRLLKTDAPPERATEPALRLLRLADGTPLITASPPGTRLAAPTPGDADAPARRGLVVLFAVAWSFEWTDLPARPLMVPLLHELVVQGVARSRGDWTAPAGARPELPPRTAEIRPWTEGGPAPIPADRAGRAAEPLRTAGLWRAVDERAAPRGLLVINPDPAAGRSDAQAASAVQSWLAAAVPGGRVQWLESAPAAGGQGAPALRERLDRGPDSAPFAFALLLAALGLAVVEIGLARWFSHARVGAAEAAA